MEKKIIIFKNDRVGDLIHSIPTINDIIFQNQDKKIVIFLSKISENFYFLFKKNNTKLKTLNYHLTIIEKIKIFLYIFTNKIEKVYILSPKNFYFYLPIFFLRIKFFGLCVNGPGGYRRPYSFLRKLLHKFVINDRETIQKRKSTQLLQLELINANKVSNTNTNLNFNTPKLNKLKNFLPSNYLLIHFKKKIFDELNWGTDGLELMLAELRKYNYNVVLIKDIEVDQNNLIFRNKFKTYDFKTNKFYNNKSDILFLDNIGGIDLYSVIKSSSKVIATHGMMTNLAYFCKKPVLDLYHCIIKHKDDYHSYKNAFYEFKPNYPGYDFIIPSRDLKKTLRKMKFSLINNI